MVLTPDDLLKAGFEYDPNDPECPYKYNLLTEESYDDEDEEPELFIGAFGAHEGFYLCVEGVFVSIDAETPREALDWGNKITGYEPR